MNDIPRHLPSDAPSLDLCDPKLASRFDNSFVRELPADPLRQDFPRPVRNACFSHVRPAAVAAPELLAWADSVGELLGIARPQAVTGPVVDVLGGNLVLPGMQPYAARYGGHQFGNWAGQLGDGRAMTLVEMLGPDGRRRELQLKGAGRTPYSRRADGRAVLRSSVREFLCSEAMHYLGVPTTRALSLVGTGDAVERDMFYDGNAEDEPGAIVCRVAPSFVRFGSFEILTSNDELDELRRLADYVITTHYPELGAPSPEVYARWFEEICRRTAIMVAEWMRVGFVHGVMNTDNMSILGLTIDYGPYGWLEGYDLGWTPNTTDAQGRRYCYGRQPEIAQWNLLRLAGALSPLIPDRADLEAGINTYGRVYGECSRRIMGDKLGLLDITEDDDALVEELIEALHVAETDMTLVLPPSGRCAGRFARRCHGRQIERRRIDCAVATGVLCRRRGRRRASFGLAAPLHRPPAPRQRSSGGAAGTDESRQPQVCGAQLPGAARHRCADRWRSFGTQPPAVRSRTPLRRATGTSGSGAATARMGAAQGGLLGALLQFLNSSPEIRPWIPSSSRSAA